MREGFKALIFDPLFIKKKWKSSFLLFLITPTIRPGVEEVNTKFDLAFDRHKRAGSDTVIASDFKELFPQSERPLQADKSFSMGQVYFVDIQKSGSGNIGKPCPSYEWNLVHEQFLEIVDVIGLQEWVRCFYGVHARV